MNRYTARTQLCYIIRYYTKYQLHVSAIGHHEVVLSLQSIIYSVYLVGDEISFTMVRYMNSLNRMVPIFVISIPYFIFCSYCYTLLNPVVTLGHCVPVG